MDLLNKMYNGKNIDIAAEKALINTIKIQNSKINSKDINYIYV